MRRRSAVKREIIPDVKYNSKLIAQLINTITCVQTPRRCGQALNARDLLFFAFVLRPKRTS